MTESAAGAGLPIPAEVIGLLTEVAARMAARSKDVRPTEASAVATTQAKALELLMSGTIPGSEQRRVYVITMTGRFVARGSSPLGKPPEGTVMTAMFNADTLRVLTTSIGDQDDRALLPQLGPVSILPIR
jgi:hypothetical protein